MKHALLVVASLLALAAVGAGARWRTPRAPVPFADEAVEAAQARTWAPIDTGAFADSIHHAVMRYADEEPPYERYRPEQIIHLAENLLAYQNGDGGWPKNIDWLKVLSEEERAQLPHGRLGARGARSTLDNRTTWSQIDYLARVLQRTGLERYAQAAARGIDHLLREQRASGGWRGADVEAITFNDDVMTGVLHTLRAVAQDEELYGWVDDERRARAKIAYERGIACILRCQIRVDGRLTAWCQQHDHRTFEPVWARSFEPASITAGESAGVARLLMEIDDPSPEIVRAVQAAVAWFARVRIEGLRIEEVPAEPTQFPHHYSDTDRVEVRDPEAPPIWARFYHLQSEEPVFCDRDRRITRHYSELSRERRTGYAYYGRWPASLLAGEYPVWQQKWAPGENVLEGGGAR